MRLNLKAEVDSKTPLQILVSELRTHWANTCPGTLQLKENDYDLMPLSTLKGFSSFRGWDGRFGIIHTVKKILQDELSSYDEANRNAIAVALAERFDKWGMVKRA